MFFMALIGKQSLTNNIETDDGLKFGESSTVSWQLFVHGFHGSRKLFFCKFKKRERKKLNFCFFFCDSEKCLKSLKTQEFHNITHLLASDSLKVNHQMKAM